MCDFCLGDHDVLCLDRLRPGVVYPPEQPAPPPSPDVPRAGSPPQSCRLDGVTQFFTRLAKGSTSYD